MTKYIFRKKLNSVLAAFLDFFGHAFFWVFRRQTETTPPKHILIVRLDHLGDVFFAGATPKIIKENFPHARLTFLTSAAAAPLLQNNPFIDEVLTYDAPWFARSALSHNQAENHEGIRKGGVGFFRLAKILRGKKIGLGLSLRGDLRENFLLWFARINRRVGYGVTGGGFFLTNEVRYRKQVHESEHTLDLLRSLGIRCDRLEPQIYFSEKEKTEEVLKRYNLPPEGRYVGVQFEAGTEAKVWPLENIQKFLELCAKNLGDCRFVVVGNDTEKFSSMLKGTHFVDLSGKTTLRELLLLLKGCKVFVGPDSGPTHIAASFGVPTLFLFSGTNVFEEWKSLAESAVFLRNEVPCSPCALQVCNVPGHPCMSGLRPEDAVSFIKGKIR